MKKRKKFELTGSILQSKLTRQALAYYHESLITK